MSRATSPGAFHSAVPTKSPLWISYFMCCSFRLAYRDLETGKTKSPPSCRRVSARRSAGGRGARLGNKYEGVEEDLRRSVGHAVAPRCWCGWDPGDAAEVSASKPFM